MKGSAFLILFSNVMSTELHDIHIISHIREFGPHFKVVFNLSIGINTCSKM